MEVHKEKNATHVVCLQGSGGQLTASANSARQLYIKFFITIVTNNDSIHMPVT
jgi:hypothetical protein